MTKLVNRGAAASDKGGRSGRGDRGGSGGRGGGRHGGPSSGGVGKKSQPERKGNSSGWKDDFREAFKWKQRAGKAVRARSQVVHPAMRLLPKGRELTKDEVRKLLEPVLQPVLAKYGGQGFAKPSTYVNIAASDACELIRELYDERVDGFSGKSYKKLGNAQDMMEWRVRLKAKVEREGRGREKGNSSPKGTDLATTGDERDSSFPTLSRKQKKKHSRWV